MEAEEIAEEIFALVKNAQLLAENSGKSEIDAGSLDKTFQETLVERRGIPASQITDAVRLLQKRQLIVVKPGAYMLTQHGRKVKHAREA